MSYATLSPRDGCSTAAETSLIETSGNDISSSSAPQHGSLLSQAQNPTLRSSIWQQGRAFYNKNIGLVFVFFAQVFASIMAMTTKLLSTGFKTKFHALQIIFVRMLATAIIGSVWMWYKQIEGFPWGPRGVRGLLVLRGMAGSIGLFGFYYSLSYLAVSDATLITFLVPTLTSFVCWIALGEPFTVKEASAGLIALIGVVFIARPSFLFPSTNNVEPPVDGSSIDTTITFAAGILPPVKATPLERSIAIGCAIMGSFCAATAYATIRMIGKRAHSLVSVNAFAVTSTVSSFLILIIHPTLHFEIPKGFTQWALLVTIGVSGFLLQVLLTEGLQREKAGRATNLIYTQLIFSLIIDYTVWGTTPPNTSLLGSVFIISAAVWVSLQKRTLPTDEPVTTSDEERQLLRTNDENRVP